MRVVHEEMRLTVDPATGKVYGRSGVEVGALQRHGYRRVGAWVDGKLISRQAHRVVWEAVNGYVPNGLVLNHKNGIKDDNRLANLEVVTPSENQKHAYRMGLACNKGARHPGARLTPEQVTEIRRRAKAGEMKTLLADEFQVSYTHLKRIAYGKSWACEEAA